MGQVGGRESRDIFYPPSAPLRSVLLCIIARYTGYGRRTLYEMVVVKDRDTTVLRTGLGRVRQVVRMTLVVDGTGKRVVEAGAEAVCV